MCKNPPAKLAVPVRAFFLIISRKKGEHMKRGKHSASGKRQSRKRAKSN